MSVSLNPQGETLSLSWAEKRRTTKLTYPDGHQLTYQYDALDRVSQAGSSATFTYTKDGWVKTIGYGNGLQTTYAYDNRRRARTLYSRGA